MQSIERPFPGQKPDEKVILFVRKHWVSFLGFIGLTLGMIIIPVIFLIVLVLILPDFFIAFRSIIILVGSAYLLFVLAFFLVGWIDYYFDIVIVTDRRIVDIHQQRLFSRSIDELDLFHIEDVSAQTKGILPTLFHFGNVHIQTAGAARNFDFESVPRPQAICRQIMTLYDQAVSLRSGEQKAIDRAEGLGERHIHPSGEKVKKEFQKEISEAGQEQVGSLIPEKKNYPYENQEVETKFQSQSSPKTNYKKLLEKDRRRLLGNQKNLDGEIQEGDQIDLSDDSKKH